MLIDLTAARSALYSATRNFFGTPADRASTQQAPVDKYEGDALSIQIVPRDNPFLSSLDASIRSKVSSGISSIESKASSGDASVGSSIRSKVSSGISSIESKASSGDASVDSSIRSEVSSGISSIESKASSGDASVGSSISSAVFSTSASLTSATFGTSTATLTAGPSNTNAPVAGLGNPVAEASPLAGLVALFALVVGFRLAHN